MKRCMSLVVFGFGCGAPPPPSAPVANTAAPTTEARHDGPCDLVEAMLSIDDPSYQEFFHDGCGSNSGRGPLIVDVDAPSLVPAGTQCDGRAFRLYRGEPITELILQLALRPKGDQWHVIATMVQPTPKHTPGGFQSIDSYCGVQGGYVELRDGTWRTFSLPVR